MPIALFPPVWSPDGQRIAFNVYEGEYHPYTRAIYTVEADGSELKRIGEATTPATWSPDSGQLAFARAEGKNASIYTARPDGTDLRQIWSGELKTPITRVSWSPDGSELLVVSGLLWAITPDGTGMRPVGSSNPPVWLYDAAWSPDGSRIAALGALSPSGSVADSFDSFTVITMARNGTDVRVLVGMDVDVEGWLYAWSSSRLETSVDPTSCSAGSVVPEPKADRGLVQDCEVLLGIRDMLAGSASLNWNAGVSILQWQGVVVAGSPPRVQRLALVAAGLTGVLPPELGQLTELRWLNVAGGSSSTPNGLTGVIPPELGSLVKLEGMDLSSNFLSGPIPEELGNLTGLGKLDLRRNFLSGCIPVELSHLTVESDGLERCIPTEVRIPRAPGS